MMKRSTLEGKATPSRYSTDPFELRMDTEKNNEKLTFLEKETNIKLTSLEDKLNKVESNILETKRIMVGLFIVTIVLAFFSGGNCIEFIIKLIIKLIK